MEASEGQNHTGRSGRPAPRFPGASSQPSIGQTSGSPADKAKPTPARQSPGKVDKATSPLRAKTGIGDKAGSGAGGAIKDIAKAGAKGASGKSTEGKAFGGGLTGAAAGMVREAAHHASWKWIVPVVLLGCMPVILLIAEVAIIGAIVAGISSDTSEASAQAAISSTGVTQSNFALYQNAVASTETPWEVIAAIAYYESGRGKNVGQTPGICPPTTEPNTPTTYDVGTEVCPAIGQQIMTAASQTVPVHAVPKSSPDRVTTNTPDWSCIRSAESGNDYLASGGAYGISQAVWRQHGEPGTPASATRATQNSFALEIFAQNGYQFNRFWHDSCTKPVSKTASQGSFDTFGLIAGKRYPQTTAPVPSSELGSATWLASQVTVSLERGGGWTSGSQYSLADGVTESGGNAPRVDLTSYQAHVTRQMLLTALASLPIHGNSSTLDTNIYELSLDWSVAYTPSTATPSETGCAVAFGSTLIIPASGGGEETLNAQQLANASTIVSVGQQLGISTTGIEVAIDVALTESSLENLPNVNVPGSETNPNAQWGSYSQRNPPSNGTSLGLFQQQNLWGTVSQRMDQAWSAAAFFGTFTNWSLTTPHPSGLKATTGWQAMTIAEAAQAVQGSGDPIRYLTFVNGAQSVVGYFVNSSCAGVPVSTAGATHQGVIAIRAAESRIGTPYVWGGGNAHGPTMGLSGTGAQNQPSNLEGQPGFDCSGLVQYAYAQAGVNLPRTSEAQALFVQSLGGWTTDISKLVPGDLVFFAGSDGTISSPGHVGIYLGDNRMIQAPQSGQDVDVVTITAGNGLAGGGPVTGA